MGHLSNSCEDTLSVFNVLERHFSVVLLWFSIHGRLPYTNSVVLVDDVDPTTKGRVQDDLPRLTLQELGPNR